MTVDATATRRPARALHITLWVLQVLLGVFFIAVSGAPKLLGDATALEVFRQIGIGDWFRYFVGVVEIAGGIGLLIPRLAGLAAFGLFIVMVGAVVTSLFIMDAGAGALFPAALGVIFLWIAYVRRDDIRSALRMGR